ncbi:MAG: hypothetical protein ABI688_08185 [Bacteroidota bacterium]
MKKIFPLVLFAAIVSTQLSAQPSLTQVKTDFMKDGVTSIEGLTIEKSTHLDHAATKASFREIVPVKPEEVWGKTGVTLVRYIVADYECAAKTCTKTRSSIVNSEYKGIDIPAPDNGDLVYRVKKQLMNEPSKLGIDIGTKTSFDSVKVIEPKINWINPLKLEFDANVYYTDKISPDLIAMESPLHVILVRDDTASSFKISTATQHNEKNKELSRRKTISGPTKGKEGPTGVATPPVAGAWKAGDKVLVQENAKWYPATVVYAKPKEWFIQYDGYDSQNNEWVEAARIKNK